MIRSSRIFWHDKIRPRNSARTIFSRARIGSETRWTPSVYHRIHSFSQRSIIVTCNQPMQSNSEENKGCTRTEFSPLPAPYTVNLRTQVVPAAVCHVTMKPAYVCLLRMNGSKRMWCGQCAQLVRPSVSVSTNVGPPALICIAPLHRPLYCTICSANTGNKCKVRNS